MADDRLTPRHPRGALSFAVVAASGAALLVAEPSCLDRHDAEVDGSDEARCATCHGDSSRAGDFLLKSAPPRDLLGESNPVFAGVGAHQTHLMPSGTHGPIACAECHVVPETVEAAGHADDAGPAEVTLGSIARTRGRDDARYQPGPQTCVDSWCHRDADAVWTAPRSSDAACGSCHALPPAPPHPPSDRCARCHGDVIDDAGRFHRPELHVDGVVQYTTGTCTACHGSGEDPAPPADTQGNTAVSFIGVGAHQAHLAGGASSRPVECSDCHLVPTFVDSIGHLDGAPAELIFGDIAKTSDHEPSWDRAQTTCTGSWCHGPGAPASPSPSWIDGGGLGCGSCHGMPPDAPHPQMTDCSRCHAEVVGNDDMTVIDRARHVDGKVDVAFDQGCTACHGGTNPAPPVDLAGSSSTSSPGVGAHQIHLAGTARSRAVPCGECHLVPEDWSSEGHLDTPPPAEVVFSGAAVAYGGGASYANGSCQNTSCHGAVFPQGHASGATNPEPLWTVVDGSQATCGSCHGLPPPAPHPKGDLNPVCAACHENISPDNATFEDPELHVDGVVTFTVP